MNYLQIFLLKLRVKGRERRIEKGNLKKNKIQCISIGKLEFQTLKRARNSTIADGICGHFNGLINWQTVLKEHSMVCSSRHRTPRTPKGHLTSSASGMQQMQTIGIN